MTANLSSQITRYGVSESFNSFFDSLRDTPGLNDKKFRLADVNKMAQYLVCRNYGKACLELSYLAWAVVNYPTETLANAPLLEFFWVNENITPARFRQAFKQPYHNKNISIDLNETGLSLALAKQSFVISPTRVGLLAVLLEIIVTLDPKQLTVIEQRLKNTNNEVGLEAKNDKAIKALSSDLQKQLYQFLAKHLIPAQQQRRFRYVSQWFDEKKSTSSFQINDEIIMSFWRYAGLEQTSPGYKLYASALYDVIDTHQALQQAKQALALDNAGSIGFNTQAGEYSPDVIQDILFNQASNIQNYGWLCQAPKFLTKSQWHFIEPIIQRHPYGKTLTLSFARLAIFGQWQASLVQAKRKSPLIMQEKLTQLPQQDYLQYQQKLSTLKTLIFQVIMAISHIFYRHQDSRYLGFILNLLPKPDAQHIKKLLEQQMNTISKTSSNLPIEAINKALFMQSQKHLIQSAEFNRVMQSAKSAFTANNKEGFQQLPNAELLDSYQDGYDALSHCQHLVESSSAQLSQQWLTSKECQANYCSDVSIFKDMFVLLYGEVYDQQ